MTADDIKIKNTADDQKTKIIRREVQSASKAIRAKYPILQHSEICNRVFYLFLQHCYDCVVSGTVPSGKNLHVLGGGIHSVLDFLPARTGTRPDSLHMYFKKNKFMHNLMMLGVWVFRPMTINPWFRRDLHFHHHRVSSTETDIEERGVTNGEKWGLKRFITTSDILLGGVLRGALIPERHHRGGEKRRTPREQALVFRKVKIYGMMPFTLLLYFVWYFFLAHYALHIISSVFKLGYQSPAVLEAQFSWINPLVAILIFPNLLRHFLPAFHHVQYALLRRCGAGKCDAADAGCWTNGISSLFRFSVSISAAPTPSIIL